MSDIAVNGDYLYRTSGTSGLEVLDISDPASITPVAQVETEFAPISVIVSGDYAYVYSRGELQAGESTSDLPYLLQKVDISDTENPEVVQELTDIAGGIPTPFQSVVTSDEYLFVLNSYSIDVVTIAS